MLKAVSHWNFATLLESLYSYSTHPLKKLVKICLKEDVSKNLCDDERRFFLEIKVGCKISCVY